MPFNDHFIFVSIIYKEISLSRNNLVQCNPFSHYICPCCHKPNEGIPLSLCSECYEDINQDGWVETGRGAWHLDRERGRIVCIYLDFDA